MEKINKLNKPSGKLRKREDTNYQCQKRKQGQHYRSHGHDKDNDKILKMTAEEADAARTRSQNQTGVTTKIQKNFQEWKMETTERLAGGAEVQKGWLGSHSDSN